MRGEFCYLRASAFICEQDEFIWLADEHGWTQILRHNLGIKPTRVLAAMFLGVLGLDVFLAEHMAAQQGPYVYLRAGRIYLARR